MNFANVYMQELKDAWKMTAKTLPHLSPSELADRRITFYMGALTVHAIINNASKLPDNLASKVIDSMDREIDAFKVEMHKAAQRVQDEARARELGEAKDAPA